MSKLSLKNNLLNVTIYDRSIVCPHQALDRQNTFSLLNIFSDREKDAGVRLCPRRRREAPGTRRALAPDPDGAGDLVTSFARIRGGGARSVRGLRRRCSGWGGVGAQSSWPSAPPPWSWWTSAARPPPGAACHTHQDTQVGDIRDINDTCDRHSDMTLMTLWHTHGLFIDSGAFCWRQQRVAVRALHSRLLKQMHILYRHVSMRSSVNNASLAMDIVRHLAHKHRIVAAVTVWRCRIFSSRHT